MLTPEQIRAALQDRRIDAVAEATGIHRNSVSAIRRGDVTNPSWETVRKLSEYLEAPRGADMPGAGQ